MSEKRYVVPEGMLKAAQVGEQNKPYGLLGGLQAALRWLAENPIVPTDEQFRSVSEVEPNVKLRLVEWQRRMLIAPEPRADHHTDLEKIEKAFNDALDGILLSNPQILKSFPLVGEKARTSFHKAIEELRKKQTGEQEVPEAVRDLLWDGSNDLEDESNCRIIAAYCRGTDRRK